MKFIFGMPAVKKVEQKAEQVAESQWKRLTRPPKHTVNTAPRQRPENVKDQVVIQREFNAVHLNYEQITDFEYSPVKCRKSYRIVVLKKHLLWAKGQHQLWDEVRYFYGETSMFRVCRRSTIAPPLRDLLAVIEH